MSFIILKKIYFRREMLSSGVTVSIIEPGVFNTTLLNEEEYRKAAKEKIDSLPAEVRKSTPDVLINRGFLFC